MKKENNEDIREVFTYSNFKKAMVKIQEIEAENLEIKNKSQEIESKNLEIEAKFQAIEDKYQEIETENEDIKA